MSTSLAQFNSTIQQWIDSVDQYSLEMLHRPPREGSWSLGQVYTHILDDTEWFVGQMEAALKTTGNSDKEMHENAKWMFANNGFPDMQIQGPATNVFIPQPQSREEVKHRLMAIKAEVNRLFGHIDPTQFTGKTQHPGLLFFSAGEWLQFTEMHLRHHLRQKQRIDEFLNLSPE